MLSINRSVPRENKKGMEQAEKAPALSIDETMKMLNAL